MAEPLETVYEKIFDMQFWMRIIRFWCEMIIHARPGQSGKFKKLLIDPTIEKNHVKLIDMTTKPGDMVLPFTGANMSLGDMFLRFDTREQLDYIMGKTNEWLKIELEDE